MSVLRTNGPLVANCQGNFELLVNVREFYKYMYQIQVQLLSEFVIFGAVINQIVSRSVFYVELSPD